MERFPDSDLAACCSRRLSRCRGAMLSGGGRTQLRCEFPAVHACNGVKRRAEPVARASKPYKGLQRACTKSCTFDRPYACAYAMLDTMAASSPAWLSGRSLSDAEQSCKLTLRHLNRAHIDLLCAYEGISGSPDRVEAVQALERHLTHQLAHDTILTPLVGALAPVTVYGVCAHVTTPRPRRGNGGKPGVIHCDLAFAALPTLQRVARRRAACTPRKRDAQASCPIASTQRWSCRAHTSCCCLVAARRACPTWHEAGPPRSATHCGTATCSRASGARCRRAAPRPPRAVATAPSCMTTRRARLPAMPQPAACRSCACPHVRPPR